MDTQSAQCHCDTFTHTRVTYPAQVPLRTPSPWCVGFQCFESTEREGTGTCLYHDTYSYFPKKCALKMVIIIMECTAKRTSPPLIC